MGKMKLKFKHQQFQADASQAVCSVFEGQPKQDLLSFAVDQGDGTQGEMFTDGFKNSRILISDDQILTNLRRLQRDNLLPPSDTISRMRGNLSGVYNISIEMETGVGKTYTYIKTMLDLYKIYGWSKFIIIVPSVAIREGVTKTFEITADSFKTDYDGISIKRYTYDSSRVEEIDRFVEDQGISVMILNMQAFNSTDTILTKKQPEKFKNRVPIDVIAQTNPILIMDEPQNLNGTKTTEALEKFKPLMILRYSATHLKDQIYNLVYSLDAAKAYNMQLVKHIEAKGFDLSANRGMLPYLYLSHIKINDNGNPTAVLEYQYQGKDRISIKRSVVSYRDDLYELSNHMACYNGYIVKKIDARENQDFVGFNNGEEIHSGEVKGMGETENTIYRIQIQETIRSHLDKEEKLFHKGIKVLSLFFIDHVNNYYTDENERKGIYAQFFEQEYQSLVEEKIKEIQGRLVTPEEQQKADAYISYLKRDSVHDIHNGYFAFQKKKKKYIDSEEKNGTTNANDAEVFNLIMTDKEKLLDLEVPLRFIFSHSALREGWDNPNVFQICALKPLGNTETRRKQEVGRGLRICVNQNGERMDSTVVGENDFFSINTLTVIANESYASFAEALQNELQESCRFTPLRIDHTLFENMGYKDKDGNIRTITSLDANSLIAHMHDETGYIDDKGGLTDAYFDAKQKGELKFPERFMNDVQGIVQILSSVYNPDKLKPTNASRHKVSVRVNKKILNDRNFDDLWNLIKAKSTFRISGFDEQKFIDTVSRELINLPVAQVKVRVTTGQMGNNMQMQQSPDSVRPVDLPVRYESDPAEDLIGIISEETGLLRRITAAILMKLPKETFALYAENPFDFKKQVIRKIRMVILETLKANLSYSLTGETFDKNDVFQNMDVDVEKQTIEAAKNVHDHVVCDSKEESRFATDLEHSSDVVAYAKLPTKTYQIRTPNGDYTPDWAIAFSDSNNEQKRVFFVAETKGSSDDLDLRGIEKIKRMCAKRHFKALNETNSEKVTYEIVTTLDEARGYIKPKAQ